MNQQKYRLVEKEPGHYRITKHKGDKSLTQVKNELELKIRRLHFLDLNTM